MDTDPLPSLRFVTAHSSRTVRLRSPGCSVVLPHLGPCPGGSVPERLTSVSRNASGGTRYHGIHADRAAAGKPTGAERVGRRDPDHHGVGLAGRCDQERRVVDAGRCRTQGDVASLDLCGRHLTGAQGDHGYRRSVVRQAAHHPGCTTLRLGDLVPLGIEGGNTGIPTHRTRGLADIREFHRLSGVTGSAAARSHLDPELTGPTGRSARCRGCDFRRARGRCRRRCNLRRARGRRPPGRRGGRSRTRPTAGRQARTRRNEERDQTHRQLRLRHRPRSSTRPPPTDIIGRDPREDGRPSMSGARPSVQARLCG